jgi:hypothetical protein
MKYGKLESLGFNFSIEKKNQNFHVLGLLISKKLSRIDDISTALKILDFGYPSSFGLG